MTARRSNKPLGDLIRRYRHAAELTIPGAADAAGVDASFWRKLEHGQYGSPSPKLLAPMAKVIKAPLADLYALAGYQSSDELPAFAPYLRSKYQLPPKAMAELQRYFDHLRRHYNIPDGEPVFPRRPQPAGKPGPKPKAPPTGGPWDDPGVATDQNGASR